MNILTYIIQLTHCLTQNLQQHLRLSYDINKNVVSYTQRDTHTGAKYASTQQLG
jgi:hypothetical protein